MQPNGKTDQPNGKTDPVAIEVFRSVYDVFQTIQDNLQPNNELNEWTLMIDGIVQLTKGYITSCCKRLLQVVYDKAIDNLKSRSEFKIYLSGDASSRLRSF